MGLYQVLGGTHNRLGNYDRAAEVFNLGLDQVAENYHFLLQNGLAVNCLRRGDLEGAQTWMEQAGVGCEARGFSPGIIKLFRARTFKDAERTDEAREIYTKLNIEYPDWTTPRTELATMLIEQNIEIPEAQRLIEEAIEIATRFDHPEFSESTKILYLRGKLQLKLGNPELALELLNAGWEKDGRYDYSAKYAIQEAQAGLR